MVSFILLLFRIFIYFFAAYRYTGPVKILFNSFEMKRECHDRAFSHNVKRVYVIFPIDRLIVKYPTKERSKDEMKRKGKLVM